MGRFNNYVVGFICIIVILLFALVILNCKRTYYVPEGFTTEGSNAEQPVKEKSKKKKRVIATPSTGPDNLDYSQKIATSMESIANKANNDHAAHTQRIKGEIVSVNSSFDKPKNVKVVSTESTAESEVTPQESIKSAMEATKDVSFPTDYPSLKIDTVKAIKDLKNPIAKIMSKVGALSIYFANPQVWVDVISQARMSPAELARKNLDKELAEKKASESLLH